ncbi:hypothetical protein Tco_0052434 [Tanacetum coccineum]
MEIEEHNNGLCGLILPRTAVLGMNTICDNRFDRLLNSAHFLAMREDATLEKLTRQYLKEVVSKHGVPIQVDDKLNFIEEPVEIMDREVKRLKQSRIPIVKVRWNSRRGPEFTWEREDQMQKKYPHLFTNSAPAAEDESHFPVYPSEEAGVLPKTSGSVKANAPVYPIRNKSMKLLDGSWFTRISYADGLSTIIPYAPIRSNSGQEQAVYYRSYRALRRMIRRSRRCASRSTLQQLCALRDLT